MLCAEEMGFIGTVFISLADAYPALILVKGGRQSERIDKTDQGLSGETLGH